MKINKLLFYLQFFITIVIFIIGVLCLFFANLFPVLEILMGIDLLFMFMIHSIIAKSKKNFIYLVIGIILIVIGLLSLLGVI